MKMTFGIMETYKTRNLTEYSLNSWIKDREVFIFTDKYNENDNRFVKITDKDDYKSNTIKNIFGLRYMFEKCRNSDFYIFMDNDTYMNFDNLDLFLLDKNSDDMSAYGLVINHWNSDRNLYYLSGGSGFILTHKTMCELYDRLEKNETDFKENYHYYADVTMGVHMRNHAIKLLNSDLFHGQPPEFYNLSEIDIKKSISFHYLNTIDKMKKIVELCEIN
jgi:hypothetical protein